MTFDQAVQAGNLPANDLILNPPSGNQRRAIAQAFGAGTSVVLNTGSAIQASDGSQTTTYLASTSAFVGLAGTPVAPWAGLPYAIV